MRSPASLEKAQGLWKVVVDALGPDWREVHVWPAYPAQDQYEIAASSESGVKRNVLLDLTSVAAVDRAEAVRAVWLKAWRKYTWLTGHGMLISTGPLIALVVIIKMAYI